MYMCVWTCVHVCGGHVYMCVWTCVHVCGVTCDYPHNVVYVSAETQ